MYNPFKKSKLAARETKKEEPKPKKSEAVKPESARPKGERKVLGFDFLPHLTEKGVAGNIKGWYVFRVPADANKIAVKRAVEDRYGVKISRVHILIRGAKKMRLGRIEGRAGGFKKAMVKLKEGSIEFA